MSAGFCKKKFSTNKISSFYFMAPERILAELEKEGDNDLWTKCDIWSVGCILFFLTFGKVPFVGENNHHIVKNIKKGFSVSSLNQDWGEEILSLLKLIEILIQVDPRERPDAAAALNCEFLTQVPKKNSLTFKHDNLKRMTAFWDAVQLKDAIKDYASFMGSAHFIAAAFEQIFEEKNP